MTIVHRLLLILVLTFYGSVMMFGQTSTNDISDNDKQKLLYIAHKFVKRYQQTRDIAPLLPEFFIGNFGECLMEMRKFEEGKNELTKKDFIRGYVAEINSLYIVMVAGTYASGAGNDAEGITELFPTRIAKRFNQLAKGDGLLIDSDFSDRKQFLRKLKEHEAVIVEAQSYLRMKRIEQSAKYQKEFRKIEKDFSGYFIKAVPLPEDFHCKAISETAVKGYIALTPLGLQLIFAKIHNRFKLILAGPIDD